MKMYFILRNDHFMQISGTSSSNYVLLIIKLAKLDDLYMILWKKMAKNTQKCLTYMHFFINKLKYSTHYGI